MRTTIDWEPEVIFQGDEANAGAGLHRETENMGFPVSMLFDCSHGAGVLPRAWPNSIPSIKCGYAVGMGPKNIGAQIVRIEEAYQRGGSSFPYWVDMETLVRTDESPDEFDLKKCLAVAVELAPLVITDDPQ